MTRLAELLGTRLPLIQAPMASGPSTPELAAAVSNAGGLGSLAAGPLPADDLRGAIRATRALTDRPFGVNVFAPLPEPEASPELVEAVRRILAPFRERAGLAAAPALAAPLSRFAEQLEVVLAERVPVFSFTFGIPPLDGLEDVVKLGTATSVAEAVELERAGVDAVVAQGVEAGGHRGFFRDDGLVGTMALVPQIAARVSVPVVAAGGIMTGQGIAAALALGADGVQLGTAFVATPESGAPAEHKQALRTAERTVITDAYSGRPARQIPTELTDALAGTVAPYPLQAALVGELRTAGWPFLLTGQGAPLARDLPAAELVAALEQEAAEVGRDLSA